MAITQRMSDNAALNYIANALAQAQGRGYNKEFIDDGTYTYVIMALPGTAVTTAEWQIKRINNATGEINWADGDDLFDNVATDTATIAALEYYPIDRS